MHVMTLDTSREQIMWWIVWMAAGLALALMPITTGGLEAIPADQGRPGQRCGRGQQRRSPGVNCAGAGRVHRDLNHPAGPATGRTRRTAAQRCRPVPPRPGLAGVEWPLRLLSADQAARFRRRDGRPDADCRRARHTGRVGGAADAIQTYSGAPIKASELTRGTGPKPRSQRPRQ